jgi:uncharacterized RDD family membrane protein YckC
METTILENVTSSKVYPSLSDRVQSSFIDVVLIVILMFVASSVLDKYENAPDWIRIVLFFGLWAIYEPLCTTLGFTLGNYMKGIRVRRYTNESKRINFFAAFVRYCMKVLLGWISFITIHFNPEKRAIHDFAVGSVMVKSQKDKNI